MLIRGTRKVHSGRSVSRCPHVDLVVTPMSSRFFLDFTEGGHYALTWRGIAEVVSKTANMKNLADAGITPTQFIKLCNSIAERAAEGHD